MPKGVPWTKEQVDLLLDLNSRGASVADIAGRMSVSEQAVMKKIERLGLKVVHQQKPGQTTPELIIPKELPTIEEALKILAAAMTALEQRDLARTEIMRLKALIQATSLYKQFFADYVDYRRIEADLIRLSEKYEQLANRYRGGENVGSKQQG